MNENLNPTWLSGLGELTCLLYLTLDFIFLFCEGFSQLQLLLGPVPLIIISRATIH